MKKYVIIMLLAFTIILQGCSKKTENSEVDTDAATKAPTVEPSTTQAPSTQTPSPTSVLVPTLNPNLVLPLTVNDSGKVRIQTVSMSKTYPNNTYMITSINGESVIVDPTDMPSNSIIELNPAAIVSTHNHDDHKDANYIDTADNAQQLLYEEGEIETKDFKIYSIAASHNGDTIDNSNFIMVFEVDGLRIAHMGDIGQTALTEDQLTKLGKIDIAITQFENSYSDMSAENEKGFNIMEQVNPKMIIKTHCFAAGEAKVKEKYGELKIVDNLLEVSKEDLPEKLTAYKILNKYIFR